MAVVSVTKMWSKTGGSLSSEKANVLQQEWAVTEGYQVEVEVNTPIDQVVTAAGLPYIASQHPSGIQAYCKVIDPQRVSPILWQVIAKYEGEMLDLTVDIEWTDVTTTEPVDRDWNGLPILTANDEQVDGLSMDVTDQVCVIRRKFASFNAFTIAPYRRATNSDTFLGWPAGTARLIGFAAKNQFIHGAPQELWDVTARIQFREPHANTTSQQAWYKRWRHEGLYVKRNGVVGRALDEFGQEKTKSVLLKDGGEEETDPNNAVFRHTQVYGSLPYSGLGLT